jgi:hypothetical protein
MTNKYRNQRGVALILAMFALIVVTSIALGMMYLADTESGVDSNFRDEQVSYYAARAGLEEARDRMRTTAGTGITISASLPTAVPGTSGGVLYIINPKNGETVAPWSTTLNPNPYFDDEICKEVTCGAGLVPPTSDWYYKLPLTASNPALTANSTYAATPVQPYKWMRLSLKINQSAAGTSNIMYVTGSSTNPTYYTCWDYTTLHESTQLAACASPNNPVYLLTALALTPSGTRRMLQYELTQDSLNLNFPAALTLDGSNSTLSTVSGPNSNNYKMEGNDHPGCGGTAGTGGGPAIGTTNTPDISTVIGGIPSNRLDHYTGTGTVCPGVTCGTPDVENVSTSVPAAENSVSSLNALLNTIQANVTQPVLTPTPPATAITNLSNPGTATSPQIIYVNGDLTLTGNVTGYGILVVTGTFTPGGNVGWNGIVLVVGKGSVIGNGGGNSQYNGAMLVAQTVDPNPPHAPLTSLGTANFDFSGGGGNGIYFSSGCIAQASQLSNYRVLASHELLY